MEIDVQPGTYVAAVSGGVDSMVLLDVLCRQPGVRIIVAHYDHGIRPDSAEDRRLVQATAARYGLPFEYEEGKLGPGASEETARDARYRFLEKVRAKYDARAIITAHHQDDMLETAILNVLRGTGRKGLVALTSSPLLARPLLRHTKADVHAYAEARQITWREDSTNADDRYLRNYVRHHIVPRLEPAARNKLLAIIERTRATGAELDAELQTILRAQAAGNTLDKRAFAMLPHDAAKELLASWLRAQDMAGFDARTLERVTVAAKTQRPGGTIDVMGGVVLRVGRDTLALEQLER